MTINLDMKEFSRAHVIFNGRVQGVFFRANTKKEAEKLGLKGWVRNLPASQVEMIAEGEKKKVDQLIEWCSNEQPIARVTSRKIEWQEPKKETSFKIIH